MSSSKRPASQFLLRLSLLFVQGPRFLAPVHRVFAPTSARLRSSAGAPLFFTATVAATGKASTGGAYPFFNASLRARPRFSPPAVTYCACVVSVHLQRQHEPPVFLRCPRTASCASFSGMPIFTMRSTSVLSKTFGCSSSASMGCLRSVTRNWISATRRALPVGSISSTKIFVTAIDFRDRRPEIVALEILVLPFGLIARFCIRCSG